MPKSVSLTRPSSAIRTLPGLTSRWVMPARCAARSAARRGEPDDRGLRRRQHAVARRSSSRGCARAPAPGRRPAAPSSTTTSNTVMTLGCDSPPSARASRMIRSRRSRASLLGHARRDLQLLDRHPALQHVVVAGPDGAHRAAAELRGQPVAPSDEALLVVLGAGHVPILTSRRSRTVGSPPSGDAEVRRYLGGGIRPHDRCDDHPCGAPSGGLPRSPQNRPPACRSAAGPSAADGRPLSA